MMRLSALAFAVIIAGFSTGAHAGWFSDETPPVNAKPLSEVIRTVEQQGYGTITEVEFEHGVWEIEVHLANGKEKEIKVDPVSGKIKS